MSILPKINEFIEINNNNRLLLHSYVFMLHYLALTILRIITVYKLIKMEVKFYN